MIDHTPGPWECGINPAATGPHNELVVRPVGEFPHGLWVADCGPWSDPERVGNARLIAAAPELLDIVKRLGVYLPAELQAEVDAVLDKVEP